MMNWIQGWRKKAIFLGVVSLVSIFLIRDRRGNFDQLEQLQTRLLTCTHYSDSLVSQLEVINRYKQTVEDLIAQQKNENRKAVESFEFRIRELTIKNEGCQNRLDGCKRSDQNTDRVLQLQSENAEQKAKIEQLEVQIQQLNEKIRSIPPKSNPSAQSEAKDGQVNITDREKVGIVQDSANIPSPPLPPAEAPQLGPLDETHPNEAKVYAQGPNVHFHRNRPLDEPLEFRRDGGEEEPPADFIPQQELVKKLEVREQMRNAPKDPGVEDFQVAKPDANEIDYKEMEH